MKVITKNAILFFILITCLSSCEDDKQNSTYHIKGFAQKGPYNTGSNITLFELDENLNQTGRSFNSTVTNKYGEFDFPGIELSSNFVEIIADGNYFHERLNGITSDRLILKALSDLSASTQVNVNILTSLQLGRLRYLVQEENKTFSAAKIQTQEEILKILEYDDSNNEDFAFLDISKQGENNTVLTAISCIIQGYRSLPELSQFITEISSDIKPDGILDSEILLRELVTSAKFLSTGSIRKNLNKFYDDTTFNGLSRYVQYFLTTTDIESSDKIKFPQTTSFGTNILNIPDHTNISVDEEYCVAIDFQEVIEEIEYSITILKTSGTGSVTYIENDVSGWYYYPDYQSENYHGINLQGFNTFIKSDVPLNLTFDGHGEILISQWIVIPDTKGGIDVFNPINYLTW